MIGRLIGYTFCLCFAGMGLFFAIQSLYGIMHGHTVAQWPTAPATLQSCKLDAWNDEGSVAYRIWVSYTYALDGKPYTASGIHPAVGSGGKELLPLYEKLKSAKVVEVRYNPSNPSEAYLFGGIFTKTWAEAIGGLLFLSFGALFALCLYAATSGRTNYVTRLVVVR